MSNSFVLTSKTLKRSKILIKAKLENKEIRELQEEGDMLTTIITCNKT